jgi:hypothetical protein
LPHWLDRILPHISIEGSGYFEERDAVDARERSVPAEA